MALDHWYEIKPGLGVRGGDLCLARALDTGLADTESLTLCTPTLPGGWVSGCEKPQDLSPLGWGRHSLGVLSLEHPQILRRAENWVGDPMALALGQREKK